MIYVCINVAKLTSEKILKSRNNSVNETTINLDANSSDMSDEEAFNLSETVNAIRNSTDAMIINESSKIATMNVSTIKTQATESADISTPNNVTNFSLSNTTANNVNNTVEEIKRNQFYLNDIFKSKLTNLKLLISLLLFFAFTTLPFQIQAIIQKFGLFYEYHDNLGFKIFVLFSVFLLYSISAINCVVYLYYSKILRRYFLKFVQSFIIFKKFF